MTVRCAHCGEELLGAVNRCWKCGKQFAAQPTVDGLPPVRVEAPSSVGVATAAASEPLEARVLDDSMSAALAETTVLERPSAAPSDSEAQPQPRPPPPKFPPPPNPLDTPPPQPVSIPSMRRHVPPRPNIAAIGGAYAALAIGIFALALSPFRWEAAIVGLVGLVMGLWGLYSPRRGWALLGMLLCALAIGWGTFTGVNELYVYLNRNAPIVEEESPDEDVLP